MKSNLISKSETTSLLKKISEEWEMEFPKMKNIKVHQILDDAQIITGEGIKILKINEDYLPFLSETEILKKFTEFEKGKLVCIVEETHHKFLAIGRAMVSSVELESMEKGEIIQNMHYISDRFWETGKTIYD